MNFLKKNPVLFFFLTLTCFFYLDKFFMGPLTLVRSHDSFDSEFQRYVNIAHLIKEYGLTNWFPNYQGGIPTNAWHHPHFYILCLLSLVFPPWLIYSFLVLSLMLGAGYGMYLFLKQILSVDKNLSIGVGVLYALFTQTQGNAIVHTPFNFIFPLFFVFFYDIVERTKTDKSVVLKILCLNFIFINAYPVLTLPYYPLYQTAFIWFLPREKRLRFFIFSVIFWTGYVLFNGMVLFNLFNYIPYANRLYPTAEFDWSIIARFFLDTWGSGVVPLLRSGLALFALIPFAYLSHSKLLRKSALITFAAILVSNFFTSGLYEIFGDTFLSKMDLEHFFWLIPVNLFLTIALGFDQLLKSGDKRKQVLFTFSLPLLCFVIYFSPKYIETFYNIFILVFAFVFYSWSSKYKKTVLITLFIIIAAGFRLERLKREHMPFARIGKNHTSLSSFSDELKESPFRVASVGGLFPMEPQYNFLESVGSRGPVGSKDYKKVIKQVINKSLNSPEEEKEFDEYPYHLYLTYGDPNVYHWSILKLLNVKYVFSRNEILNNDNLVFQKKDEGTLGQSPLIKLAIEIASRFNLNLLERVESRLTYPIYIYRTSNFSPRGLLVKKVEILDEAPDEPTYLQGTTFEELRSHVTFYKKDVPEKLLPDIKKINQASLLKKGQAKLKHYSPDKLVYNVDLSSPSVFFISNNYHKNWKAYLNEKPLPIIKANHAFQGILISQAGKGKLEVRYEDQFSLPLGVAGIMALALANIFLFVFSRKKSLALGMTKRE